MAKAKPEKQGEYRELLQAWRRRPTSQPGRTVSVEAESDRGRVVFCSAFRRLHQKAQVFSLEGNAAVRTRLTHSLEVAQVGRYLAQLVLQTFGESKRAELGLSGLEGAFQSFVESACLVHDLGNPPFGHFGERAIQHWFEQNKKELFKGWLRPEFVRSAKHQADSLYKDFLSFDGNPQGFRILTRLQWNTDRFGLNLTSTQLAATMKYVCRPDEVDSTRRFFKKPGFFASETEVVDEILPRTGIVSGKRHPLAYLMEAADDIAYCLSDLEDAVEKGLFTESFILDLIKEELRKNKTAPKFLTIAKRAGDRMKAGDEAGAGLLFLRTDAINAIVKDAANAFVRDHDRFLRSEAPPLVEIDPESSIFLDLLKNIAREHIYTSKLVLQNEITGSRVIKGLLDEYKPILCAPLARVSAARSGRLVDHAGGAISSETSLFKQLPGKHLKVYDHHVSQYSGQEQLLWEPFFRMHLIVDFVSGMTDQFALGFYHLLQGNRRHGAA